MALHKRYAVTVSATVADCSRMDGHTSLSTALVYLLIYQSTHQLLLCINQAKAVGPMAYSVVVDQM